MPKSPPHLCNICKKPVVWTTRWTDIPRPTLRCRKHLLADTELFDTKEDAWASIVTRNLTQ